MAPLEDRLEMSLADVISTHWVPKGTGAGAKGKGAKRGGGRAGKGRGRGLGVKRTNIKRPAGAGRGAGTVGRGRGRGNGKAAGRGAAERGRAGVTRKGAGSLSLWRGANALKGRGKGNAQTGGKGKGKNKGAGRGKGRSNMLALPPIQKRIQKNRGQSMGKGMKGAGRGMKGRGRGMSMALTKGGKKGRGRGAMGALGGKGGRSMVIRNAKGKGRGRGMKGAGSGMKGAGKGMMKGKGRPGVSAKERWEHDRYDYDGGMGEEDAWFRARGGGKGRKGYSKGEDSYSDMGSRPATPRSAGGGSADHVMTSEDRKMMKKITIVAQLDKVPKPPAAMQGMALNKGKRGSSDSGSLSGRFGMNVSR